MSLDTLFPPSERVVYQHNPLVEVICQLRFSARLEISQDMPVEFQKRVRKDYPHFETKSEGEDKVHHFISGDGVTRVSLSSNFLAVSTSAYSEWSDFCEHIERVQPLLEELYDVKDYTRIGLRYVDVIDREALGLSEVPWSQLLDKEKVGLLGLEEADGLVLKHQQVTVFEFEGRAKMRLLSALAKSPDKDEPVAVIDADYFYDRPKKSSEVNDVLEILHTYAGRVFRACIRDTLAQALSPSGSGR